MKTFKSLGEAWLFGLREIMNHGETISDNDVRIRDVSLNGLTPELSNCILNKNGNLVLRLKEMRGLHIKIENVSHDEIIKKYADKERVQYTMKRCSCDCGENGYGEFLRGKNNEKIIFIVNKLKQNRNSKSAIIISPNEWAGNFGKAPCITAIDFFIRDNKLLMHVLYRSQNIFTKQPGNLLGLNQIHEEIAKAISIDKGPMELYVCSAHIYECDFGKVNEILKQEKSIKNRIKSIAINE